MTKVLVTGASGFLGKELCLYLLEQGYQVKGTYRTNYPKDSESPKIEWVHVSDLLETVEFWNHVIADCEIVIHSAAKVHQLKTTPNDEEIYHKVNVLGTEAILNSVLQTKTVKKFIFMSSVLVYGTKQAMPLNSNHECFPDTPYGRSKLNAEISIQNKLRHSHVSWTIFRPCVIYGNEHKGNMSSLENYIKKGIPLPVKNIPNKRSFLSVSYFCKIIERSFQNKNSDGKIYCVADRDALSTEQLVLNLGKSLNIKPRLIWIPLFLQYFLAVICDLIQKIGITLPWNKQVFTKISGNYWVETETLQKDLNL